MYLRAIQLLLLSRAFAAPLQDEEKRELVLRQPLPAVIAPHAPPAPKPVTPGGGDPVAPPLTPADPAVPAPGTHDTEPAPGTPENEPAPGTPENEPAPSDPESRPAPGNHDTEPAPGSNEAPKPKPEDEAIVDVCKRASCTPSRQRWNANNVNAVQNKGRQYLADLDNIGNTPDLPRVSVATNYQPRTDGYLDEWAESRIFKTNAERLGMDEGTMWTGRVINNKPQKVTQMEQKVQQQGPPKTQQQWNDFDRTLRTHAILEAYHSPTDGAILVRESYNNRVDVHRANDGSERDLEYMERPALDNNPAMKLSAMMYDEIKTVHGANGARNLNYAGHAFITTPQTKTVAKAAAQRMGKTMTGSTEVTFRRTGGNADETAGFEALAGTAQGKAVLHMLREHHTDFGNAKVTEIRIMPSGVGSDIDMLLTLGRPQ